ncbi:MAG TPA: GNAT family N-acetyltransferase [Azospirillaceae bacterium]|nr:GNAT family N-acetyltransferase [Azospirillaceae bacterium]
MTGSSERLVWRDFDALTPRELHDLLRLRCDVFVVEQACAFPEIDGKDPAAAHLLAFAAGGELVGCLRLFAPGPDKAARIGRVAVALVVRGTGLGRRLMAEALAEVDRRFGAVPVDLSAQAHLERFYGGFGFLRIAQDYLEDGIPHCDMRRPAGATVARATAGGATMAGR